MFSDALFELLLEMVSNSTSKDSLSAQLSSVASACLLSLVVALGDTGKMLSSVAAFLTAPGHPDMQNVKVITLLVYSKYILSMHSFSQVPQIVYQLQSSVQAVLLGSVVSSDWCTQGVTSSSIVESWPLPIPKDCGITENSFVSVAGDGLYLYFHGPFGLLKVGSGYANTKKVCMYILKAYLIVQGTLCLVCLLSFMSYTYKVKEVYHNVYI